MAQDVPRPVFEVTFAVPGEMRWCMRAKGMFDDWLLQEAESESPRPISELPAADMDMLTVDVCEFRLSWIELAGNSSWDAVKRAVALVEEVVPELLRTRRVRIEAKMQDPDPERRKPPPVGA